MPTDNQYRVFGRYVPLARSLVLAAGLGVAVTGFSGPGFAQNLVQEQAAPQMSAAQSRLFQDGVAEYRLGHYDRSFRAWITLAQAGHPAAQYNIAHLWLEGLGTEKSLDKALPWLEKSAEGGIAQASTLLGILYVGGKGLDRDYEKAAIYFDQAARSQDHRAQYNLGLMYEHGLGVEEDKNTAASWYNFAAQAGHPRAKDRLTDMQIPLDLTAEFPPGPHVKPDQTAALPEPDGETANTATKPPAQVPMADVSAQFSVDGVNPEDRLPPPEEVDHSVDTENVPAATEPQNTALDTETAAITSPATAESMPPRPAPDQGDEQQEGEEILLNYSPQTHIVATPMPEKPVDTEPRSPAYVLDENGQTTSVDAIEPDEQFLPQHHLLAEATVMTPRPKPALLALATSMPGGALPKIESLDLARPVAIAARQPDAEKTGETQPVETLHTRLDRPDPILAASRSGHLQNTHQPATVFKGDTSDPANLLEANEEEITPLAKEQKEVAIDRHGGQQIALTAMDVQPKVASAQKSKSTPGKPKSPKVSLRYSQRRAALWAYKNGQSAQALKLWSALAERGDRVGQFWLGRMYNRGEGVSRDPVKAYQLIRRAARNGYSPAVTALANLQARMSDKDLVDLERTLSDN